MAAALLASIATCNGVGAQSVLILPVEGELRAFDVMSMPLEAATPTDLTVHGAQPGACFAETRSGEAVAQDGFDCLSYYLRDLEEGGRVIEVTGVLGFTDMPPDPLRYGLQLTEAKGLEYCGEREDCDRFYITGVADPSLLAPLIEGARAGRPVHIEARELWNFESVDLLVSAVTPLRP